MFVSSDDSQPRAPLTSQTYDVLSSSVNGGTCPTASTDCYELSLLSVDDFQQVAVINCSVSLLFRCVIGDRIGLF